MQLSAQRGAQNARGRRSSAGARTAAHRTRLGRPTTCQVTTVTFPAPNTTALCGNKAVPLSGLGGATPPKQGHRADSRRTIESVGTTVPPCLPSPHGGGGGGLSPKLRKNGQPSGKDARDPCGFQVQPPATRGANVGGCGGGRGRQCRRHANAQGPTQTARRLPCHHHSAPHEIRVGRKRPLTSN